jgi:hypothetical protein
MAWQGEYKTVTQKVSKEQIWETWKDVNNWHLWDTDLEFAKLTQPFQTGSIFTLKPKGGPYVKIEFCKIEPLKSYVDFTRFPLAKMYGYHEMRETSEGLELHTRMEIKGPLSFLWRKLVTEGIVAGLEEQTQAMISYAEKKFPTRG